MTSSVEDIRVLYHANPLHASEHVILIVGYWRKSIPIGTTTPNLDTPECNSFAITFPGIVWIVTGDISLSPKTMKDEA
jgi:hypothetical protein